MSSIKPQEELRMLYDKGIPCFANGSNARLVRVGNKYYRVIKLVGGMYIMTQQKQYEIEIP